MISYAERPNMSQRSVLQCLSPTEWKVASRLPVRAGEIAMQGLARKGWIEVRGDKQKLEVRLTAAGQEVMRSRAE